MINTAKRSQRKFKLELMAIGATRNNQVLLDQSCHWTSRGNLDWRTDATLNLKESFGYDPLNRLTSAIGTELDGETPYFSQSFGFDQKGNITAKTGLESYAYNSPTNPYAVTGVQPAVGQEGLFTNQTVTYTSFDKIDTVNQDGKALTVNYGIDRQRVQQAFSDGDNVRTKRYFTPLYECVTENGVTKNLHYLTSATGLFAIFVTQNNQGGAMHYTLKDHQGSLTATICGNTVERLSYDAWGRRRNPNGFGYSNVTHTFDRGYTFHEHYDAFGLINMNGRVYDPLTSHFLSVDRYVQQPGNSQSFNRYAYCMHNPLRYTDPTGWLCSGAGPLRQLNGSNYNPEPTWHSNDNDMLWGRSLYPCETSDPERVITTSSGYMVGNALVTGNAPLSQIQAIRAYQNNPNILTSMMLENMGIDVTIGCTDGSYSGIEGFRSSEYNWTDATGQSYNANAFEYIGGNENGHYITGNEPSKNFWNENLDIAGKMLATGGTYTYMESVLHYSEVLGKWTDKQGIRRSFHENGNQYTGGKLKYGRAVSNRFSKVGRVLGATGSIISTIQFYYEPSADKKTEYAFDAIIGAAGVLYPEAFGLPSTIWFLGGKQVTSMYARKVITPMIKEGINPGDMLYQPFK